MGTPSNIEPDEIDALPEKAELVAAGGAWSPWTSLLDDSLLIGTFNFDLNRRLAHFLRKREELDVRE